MKSLGCAIQQIATNEGVRIDEEIKQKVSSIVYQPPTDKMQSTYKAFIVLHCLETNFLKFALSFFEE